MRWDTTPQFLAMFRERSAQPSISLVRKRCACGKTATAKQLMQYGKCDVCRRTA